MKYQTLLEESSLRLAELEARLAKEKPRHARAYKQGTRLCADGRKRGCRIHLNPDELEAWFWSMTLKNEINGCWEWQGNFEGRGYPAFMQERRTFHGHRFSATLVLGENPKLWVLHACDNKKCVNPSHLFLGTAQDNTNDMMAKGRHRPRRLDTHPRCKLSWSAINAIRESEASNIEVAKQFGITKEYVSKIRCNCVWKTDASPRRKDPAFQ